MPDRRSREPATRKRASAAKTTRQATKATAQCPICYCWIPSDRLTRHVKRCPQRARPQQLPTGGDKERARRIQRAHPDTGTITREAAGLASLDADLRRAKYQSDSEDRRLTDPGREWDGTFGSLPLHDDYGDESDPEEVE